MKKNFIAALTLASVCAAGTLAFAMTGDEAVAKMKSRIYVASTMRGVITMSHSSGEMYTGSFKYMAPGKFSIQFSTPPGKTIVTNGKKLWVFDKADNVCGVQDVDKTFSGGIAGYVNGYIAIASPSGAADTIIRLKSPNRTYRDIAILVDSSYMPKKITFRQENGDGFTATLSNVVINEPMAVGAFDFNAPANAQVVKNPLNVR